MGKNFSCQRLIKKASNKAGLREKFFDFPQKKRQCRLCFERIEVFHLRLVLFCAMSSRGAGVSSICSDSLVKDVSSLFRLYFICLEVSKMGVKLFFGFSLFDENKIFVPIGENFPLMPFRYAYEPIKQNGYRQPGQKSARINQRNGAHNQDSCIRRLAEKPEGVEI
jgi:hypothetical protein